MRAQANSLYYRHIRAFDDARQNRLNSVARWAETYLTFFDHHLKLLAAEGTLVPYGEVPFGEEAEATLSRLTRLRLHGCRDCVHLGLERRKARLTRLR